MVYIVRRYQVHYWHIRPGSKVAKVAVAKVAVAKVGSKEQLARREGTSQGRFWYRHTNFVCGQHQGTAGITEWSVELLKV